MNTLKCMHVHIGMINKEIGDKIEEMGKFNLFPLLVPDPEIDPKTGKLDDTLRYPCKVT